MKPLLATILVVVLFTSVCVAAFWAYDLWEDRKHTVETQGITPVFSGHGSESCDSVSKIADVPPGSKFAARRIRYWKDCATVDIVLNDGREAYVVLGVGRTSVNPPLP